MAKRKNPTLHEILTESDYPSSPDVVHDHSLGGALEGMAVMEKVNRIRVIVFESGGYWIGQCLEHNISAQAEEISTLKRRLMAAIEHRCAESADHGGEPFGGLPPAPKMFHDMWDNGLERLEGCEAPLSKNQCTDIEVDFALAA